MTLLDRLISQSNSGSEFNFQVHRGEHTKVHETLEASFQVSKKGYVYSQEGSAIRWFKFLTLGTCLGLKGLAFKCAELFQRTDLSKNQTSDGDHLLQLSDIAWKAVCGIGGKSQLDYTEKFSLAEIRFHHNDIAQALNMARSTRHSEDQYYAPCMQPVFHQNQLISIGERIETIHDEVGSLDSLKTARENLITGGFFTRLSSYLTIYTNAHQNYDDTALEKRLRVLDKSLGKIELYDRNPRLKVEAKKCAKYATMSVLFKNHSAYKENCVRSEEVRCCGSRLWKVEQICGCIYKIDCCAMKCIALDCLCCLCCFFPDDMACCCLV